VAGLAQGGVRKFSVTHHHIDRGRDYASDSIPMSSTSIRMREILAAALFYVGEYNRAAPPFDAVGHTYRQHMAPTDPVVLNCSYHAGCAYAATGNADRALPQLRYYVQNASASANEDETHKIIESRFAIGHGPDSTQVRNLAKHISRLRPAADPWISGSQQRSLAAGFAPAALPSFADRWTTLLSVASRTYAENRPYLLPETLAELVGPVSGAVQLPSRLDWSERAEFHLDDPAERNVMYERVIREATRIDDLRSYINGAVLRQAWRNLFLPVRARRIWEERFPDLAPHHSV